MSESTEIISALDQIAKSLRGVDGITKEYSETLKKATSEMLNKQQLLATGVGRTSKAYQESGNRVRALVKEMAVLKAQSREVQEAQAKLEKSADRLSKGYGGWAESIQKVYGYTKSALGTLGQYGAVLGVQSLGVKTITDRYLKYNQALFNMSRVQQVSGKGMKDFNQVLKTVKERTTLAKDQFAGLAAEVGNMSIGLAPATGEIANIAAAMKDRFGPNIDVIIAKTKEFFQLQAEWPDLAKDIEKAQDAISRKDIAGAEKFKTSALMKMAMQGKSAAEMKNAAQMIDEPTEAMKKAMELNESNAKTTQKWGDLQIDTAEKMAPMLKNLTDKAGELAEALNRIPGALADISLGMEAISVAGALGGTAILAKGLAKVGTKMMASRGAALAASSAQTAASGAGTQIFKSLPLLPSAGGGAAAATAAGAAGGAKMAGFGSKALVAGKTATRIGGMPIALAMEAAGPISAALGGMSGAGKGHRMEGLKQGWVQGSESSWIGQGAGWLGKKFGGKGGADKLDDSTLAATAELRKKRTEGIAQASKEIARESKSTLQTASQLVIKYTETMQNQRQWLDNLNQGASAFGELVSLGEKLSVANIDAARSQQAYYEQSKTRAESSSTETIKLAKQVALTQQVNLNVSDTGKAYDRLSQTMSELNKAIKNNEKDEAKVKELLNIQRTVAEQITKVRQQEAHTIDAMVSTMTTQLNINNSLNDMYENRLSTERQLMETSQFGLGASVDMMQKQVDLMQRRIESNKEALDLAAQEINKDKKLTDQQMSRLQNARSDIELRQAAKDIADETNGSQEKLLAYAKQYNNVTTDSMKQQQKILEITKQVREGYLSAMKQSAFGFGQFGKIIGTQTRGASQLMNLVKKVTGTNALNTMALGGLQSQDMTKSGVGTKASYEYSTTGVQKNVTAAQEKANLDRIWQYKETAKMASGGGTVGTGVAATPADIAVMQQRASGQSVGGRTVRSRGGAPDISKGITAVEKGSMMKAGSTLPGQYGIPANSATGANLVPWASNLMQGSTGQISNTGGGGALTPTPLKGATKEAQTSEWMKPMLEKQEETNTKLNDILGQLKSGMKVTAMNSA